jgi:hypothetical protein
MIVHSVSHTILIPFFRITDQPLLFWFDLELLLLSVATVLGHLPSTIQLG